MHAMIILNLTIIQYLFQVFNQVLAVSDMSGVPEEHDVRGEMQTLSVS